MERAVDQNDPPDAVAQRPIEVAAPRGRTIFRGKQGSGSVALQRRPKEHDRPHDRPAWRLCAACPIRRAFAAVRVRPGPFRSRASCSLRPRSEEHTSELQSLMRISYAVFCLKKKHVQTTKTNTQPI